MKMHHLEFLKTGRVTSQVRARTWLMKTNMTGYDWRLAVIDLRATLPMNQYQCLKIEKSN